jgi:hypothetical protein
MEITQPIYTHYLQVEPAICNFRAKRGNIKYTNGNKTKKNMNERQQTIITLCILGGSISPKEEVKQAMASV